MLASTTGIKKHPRLLAKAKEGGISMKLAGYSNLASPVFYTFESRDASTKEGFWTSTSPQAARLGWQKSRTLVGIRCLGRGRFVARRHLSRAADFVALDCLTDRGLIRQECERYLPLPRLGEGRVVSPTTPTRPLPREDLPKGR